MSYRFEIEAGKSKRFPVGGKYCEDDIIVTAVGGAPAPDVPDEPATPEYSEGLLIEWDDWACAYSVNGRGSCTDSVVRIPEIYDDGVNGESLVTEFGRIETGWEYFYSFYQDELLEEIYLPRGMASPFNSFSLQECPNLKKVYGVQNISSIELRNLPSLEYVEFVQYSEMALEIGGAIGSGNGVVYDFTKCTSVPYFDSYGFGSEFGTDPVILVPAELYDEWKQATNWALYADYIVAKGQENAQEKTVEITENGNYEVTPDEGKLLRKVTANVNVGGGSGDSASIDALIDGSITEINSNAAVVRNYCFAHLSAVSADVPNATSIGNNAFVNCEKLTSVNIPNAISIGDYAFNYCSKLKSVSASNVTKIGFQGFSNCGSLEKVSFSKVTTIGGYAFATCKNCLEYDFSKCEVVPTLESYTAFNKINSNAKIKVPSALYDEWIAATNWSNFASYIVAV